MPNSIVDQFKTVVDGLPKTQPYGATTLPADLPTPLKDALVRVTTAGKINLNSNGSATFAGGIDVNSESSDGMQIDSSGGVAVQRSDGSGLAFTILNKKVNTLNIKAEGSADFAQQKVNIYSNGVVRAGNNPGNDGQFGTDIDPDGPLRIRTSDTNAVRIYPSAGTDESITLNSDGSAEFAGQVKLSGTGPNQLIALSGASESRIFFRNYATAGDSCGLRWHQRNAANTSFRYDNLFVDPDNGLEYYSKNGSDFDGTETPVFSVNRSGSATIIHLLVILTQEHSPTEGRR